METPTPLEQAIQRTVTWFSLFEIPVTVFEIWKWMLSPDRVYTLEEVYEAVVESDGTKVPSRQARFLDATRKYKKLRRAVWYLRFVPGVEAIAVGNTLAWWNTRPDSDIDLFIVTRPGMIWLARLFCVTPFALLGKRPGRSRIDPFCFSFFVTSDALDLSSLRLPDGDPYLAYWTSSLVPVFDRSGVWERFKAENSWTDSYLPHAKTGNHPLTPPSKGGEQGFLGHKLPSFSRRGWGWLLERLARNLQIRRLPKHIKALMNKDSRVIVTDHMLKFHDNDRRAEYRDMLEVKCKM